MRGQHTDRLRAAFERNKAQPKAATPGPDYIARIDALTVAGRTNWFGLLGYLVFAFITVLSVEDADFFIANRQTQLPLVNISIPTLSFFLFAPILGAALYIYLHLHVRKVSEALVAPEPAPDGVTLERRIKPWLLNDLILRRHHPKAIDRRDLDRFSDMVTIALVWLAGPFVLGAIWTNSFVVHNFWLTSLAGLCFFGSILVGAISWRKMEQDTCAPIKLATLDTARMYARAVPLLILVLLYGALATKGFPLRPDYRTFFSNAPLIMPVRPFAVSPNLREAQLSTLPTDQADPIVARAKYRGDWCRRVGHPPLICGTLPSDRTEVPPFQRSDRLKWCADQSTPLDQDACETYFATKDTEFEREWRDFRGAQIKALPKPDMRNRDIRKADLYAASLTGVDFSGAQMEGADLSGAQMEGAVLWRAEMAGASLRGAQMAGAYLRGARMEGTDLSDARMEGANLSFSLLTGRQDAPTLLKSTALSASINDGGAEGRGFDRSHLRREDRFPKHLSRWQREGDRRLPGADGRPLSMAQGRAGRYRVLRPLARLVRGQTIPELF
ncbi:pentapeptide repeat family protein [Rhodovulum sp. P5]|uniref:pentapeptide repeat-containing protein n=1 Tax=Rhodovulum sp. P5 TaxID=1564506 RepID=UPI0009C3287C|nr:pentapeptide repeat-containing protein [Rhodovulum sp. P5]ARE39283.1 pentapeptide repeat family protein [Rhodovulum sp. P5]